MRMLFRNERINSMILIASLRILSLVTNIGTGMITAWSLGPTGRGIQAAMALGALTLIGICNVGLHTSLIFNIKSDPPNKEHYFGSALLIGWIVSLIGILICWFVLPSVLEHYDEYTLLIGRLLTLVVPISVTSNILIGVLEAHYEFNFVSRVGMLNSIFALIALSLLWLFGLLSPETSASSYILPVIPVTGILAWRAIRLLKPASPFHIPALKRMCTYSLRFFGLDLIRTVNGYLDQFLMVLFLDAHNVGVYSIALSAARVLSVIPTSIITVTFPSVAGRSKEEIHDIVGISNRLSTIVTLAAALFLGLFAPYILSILYGPKFVEAVSPFRILLLSGVIGTSVGILYQMFSAAGRPEIVTALEAAGLAVSAVGMMILIPGMGIDGAAVSALLSTITRLALIFTACSFILQSPVPRLIFNRADLRRVFNA